MEIEIWGETPNKNYLISSLGRVKHKKSESTRKTALIKGYASVLLKTDGKAKGYLVHRLVATAFLPNPFNKKEVNHKDGNKLNNNVTNLEWVTRGENYIHAIETNLRVPSVEVISMEDKMDIYIIYQMYGITHKDIMREYNISRRTSGRIVKGFYINGRVSSEQRLKIDGM